MAESLETTKSGIPARPDYIKEGEKGFEQVTMKDMVLPRLALCQDNTPQRKKQNADVYIPGLEEGNLFNTLSGKIYGNKIQVVPLFFYHSKIMFKGFEQGGGIVCQASDGISCQLNNGGACLHGAWGPGGEPPECTEFYNYPCLVYEGPGSKTSELIIVSLKSTGIGAAKKWNSYMRMRGADMFAGVYELSSTPDTNKAGMSYFTWAVANGDPAWVDVDLLKSGEKMYKTVSEGLKSGAIKVDDLDPDDAAFAARDSEV